MKKIGGILISIVLATFLIIAVYAQDADNGAILYAQHCADCHGENGEGGIGPSLINCSICDSLGDLIDKIEVDMPLLNPDDCVEVCAQDTAAFIFEVLNGNKPVTDPVPEPIEKGTINIELETIASGLTAPLEIKPAGDGTKRLFVVDQVGKIYIIDNGQLQSTPFLDVSDRLVSPLGIIGTFDEDDFDERGLLGLAFHPEFTDTDSPGYQKIYIYTSEPASGTADFTTEPLPVGVSFDHQSVITEWSVDSTNTNIIDTTTRREIMRIDQPQFNHNAGKLEFGPDGYLFIALGDGGSANDTGDGHGEKGNGQNTDTVHGSILRIDPLDPVGTPTSSDPISSNGKYRIPANNPFVGTDGLDEIFAYGFRNPYRFSFDTVTGELIVADVGQNFLEEVDIVEVGGNFGWNLKEGTFRFVPETGSITDNLSGLPNDLVDPVTQYDHDEGLSVIGGFVYRGTELPELTGKYVFGDFSTSFSSARGRLFYADLGTGEILELTIDKDIYIKGFGIDAAGEIYVLASPNLGPYGTGGVVYRIVEVPHTEIIGTWSSGIWYWDVAESKWTQMTSDVTDGDIAAGDFTGDGKADVASIWSSGLWYQDWDTLTWTKIPVNTPGGVPNRVTAGDVTGDGRFEIIGTWSSGIWYWDVAESKWTQMTSDVTDGDIAAGDFTGDGKADVASIWSSGLWYQDGDTLGWTKVDNSPPFRVTAGDVTGDGRFEIIGTWSSGIWYWDVAESKWTQMTSDVTDGDIAAGDFTGDGKADVASIWSSGLWYQDGDTLGWTKVDNSPPFRVTAGDVTAK